MCVFKCVDLLFALCVWAASHLDLCLVLRYLLELMTHNTRQLSCPLFRLTEWTFSKLPNFFETKNDWQLILIVLKKKTTSHRSRTRDHLSPRVKPKHFKTYPAGCCLLFTLIHPKLLLLTSPSATRCSPRQEVHLVLWEKHLSRSARVPR